MVWLPVDLNRKLCGLAVRNAGKWATQKDGAGLSPGVAIFYLLCPWMGYVTSQSLYFLI